MYQHYYDAWKKTFSSTVREEFTLCWLKALEKTRIETRDMEDPVSLNGGSVSLFYRLDDEILMSIKAGNLPFKRTVRISPAKNHYKYPEYESDFLVLHLKKVDHPADFPDDAFQRQIESERNYLLLPGYDWEFAVTPSSHEEKPYGILTYCHNSLQPQSIYLGFPCPAKEGKKWLFDPINLYLEPSFSNTADVNNIDKANQPKVKDTMRKRHTS